MSLELDMYRTGQLSEATAALMMPVMSVEAQANAVYRCARGAPADALVRETISKDIERLEKAAATLRDALNLAKPMPALRLVAAE